MTGRDVLERGPTTLPLAPSRERPAAPPVRLVARFTAIGLLVTLALAVGIALLARANATATATDQAGDITWFTGKGVVEPLLSADVERGDPAALARLNSAVHRFVLSGSLVRTKIWDASGRIVYSDEPALIGQRYELEDEELRTLRTGGRDADVSDLTRPENAREVQFGRLLEVHVGITDTDGRPMLFESYFRYDSVVDAGWAAWRTYAPISIGALLLLQLVQVPLAYVLARRLQQREAQRERLLRHAVDASTAERRRIAGDLHDGVVQELSGITYSLDAYRLQPGADDRAGAVVTDSAARLRASVGTLRTLLVDIYPPNLADEGLEPALRELAGGLERRGVAIDLDLDDAGSARDDEAALLYRAAQEALRNVVSHSGAERVEIELRRDGGSWHLTVDDDGRGFDAGTHAEREDDGHLGLRSLGDLLADAGGSLTVRAAAGAGTRVEVRVPAA
ncbi:sensor histidine kinase [Pseudonocardia endophytica]|uniref:Histidine kinase/DNA gyrase B/HSP90-like ATPase n=1 Tax=Pseudonocardia endophytica TaxID=401976 RepID=A0A4V2PIG5_PSEEN|nr:sensor histidine kinase [Pseudonocardia endophytica]TCK24466.1 histidine kinase/DNA gyrase B/HSP90-like ATPase [Pseudonocardia endophytica]